MEKIYCKDPINQDSALWINHKLKSYPDKVVKTTLDKFYVRLTNFMSLIDLDHPESLRVLQNIGIIKIFELIELAKLANEMSLNNIDNIFPKMLNKILGKEAKIIDNPLHFSRMLKSDAVRHTIRHKKNEQVVKLGKQIRSLAGEYPNNFTDFERYSVSYQKDIENAMEKSKKFQDLGCLAMAKEITDSIKTIQEEFSTVYYGFNRITVSKASAILAKINHITINNYIDFVLFPIHRVNLPNSIEELVHYLDHFPAIRCKCLFDHLYVLHISGMLSKSRVLLGDVEGKCYFITIIN